VTHVVVIGLMGAGKTSIGRRVAERLGRPFVDGDEVLGARCGRTAADVAEADGIEALHRLEAAILLEALADDEPAVIGPAASTVEDEPCRAALAHRALVVWLAADVDWIAERAKDKGHRPLVGSGDDRALFERQRAVREPLILPLAAVVVDRPAVGKDEAADRIAAAVSSAAPSSPPS